MKKFKGCRHKSPLIRLIGPFPPPYGGISIHIQRMKSQLETLGLQCVVCQLGRAKENTPKKENIEYIEHPRQWLFKNLFFYRDEILHCHGSDWKLRCAMGILGLFGRKTIITIHGASLEDDLRNFSMLKRWILRMALRHIICIVAVNPRICDIVLSLGVKPDRVVVIPAFIPPKERKSDVAAIPEEVWEFIDSHSPIISANAFKLVFRGGQDLYGVDMCIKLCSRLKPSYPKIGFVFFLPDIGNAKYLNILKETIHSEGISDNWLFQTKPCPFYPIIKRSHLLVRPTVTDGFAVSTAEAIHFGVPVIASNVCQRPDGVILFENRDLDDFETKAKNVLDNYDESRQVAANISLIDYANELVKVYSKVLGND